MLLSKIIKNNKIKIKIKNLFQLLLLCWPHRGRTRSELHQNSSNSQIKVVPPVLHASRAFFCDGEINKQSVAIVAKNELYLCDVLLVTNEDNIHT